MDTYSKVQRNTLYAGIAVCILYAAYLVAAYSLTSSYPSDHAIRIYQLAFLVLSTMYIVNENRKCGYIYHPHELGFFIWLIWPLLVPYYLVKSRGLKGIAILLLLVLLMYLESVAYLIWYVFSGDAA